MAHQKQTHAVIGLATRNRLNMLQSALASIRALQLPEATHLTVIVVENDASAQCQEAVATCLHGIEHVYAIEPVIGIARARNRVVELAKQAGADVLLFFDDDETLTPDWLVQLVSAWRGGRGLLIGGPVRIDYDWQPESRYRAFLQKAIADHYARRFQKAALAFAKRGRTLVSTNNCIADMILFTHFGLSYSEAYHTGSDKRFYLDVCELGLPTGWVGEASVQEYWPRSRTTLRYNFRRAGEQAKSQYANLPVGERHHYFIRNFIRNILSAVLMSSSLIPSGGKRVVLLVRILGRIWGLVSAGFGARADLYRNTTGN